MDPLPFLVFSVLVFWLAQIVAWSIWQYKKPKPPVAGTGQINPNELLIIDAKRLRIRKKKK